MIVHRRRERHLMALGCSTIRSAGLDSGRPTPPGRARLSSPTALRVVNLERQMLLPGARTRRAR